MIRNIRHKGLEALHSNNQARGVQQAHVKRLRQILAVLDTANTLDDIDLPGLRLHPLKGTLAGLHAVTVSGNWRVVFRFENNDTWDVDYVDYH